MDRLKVAVRWEWGHILHPFILCYLLLYEIYGLQLTKSEKGKKGAEVYRRLRLPPGNAGAKEAPKYHLDRYVQ